MYIISYFLASFFFFVQAEYEMQRDSNYLLDADLQQCVELTSPPSFIEAGTSNEIEVNTDFSKSINSDVSSQRD